MVTFGHIYLSIYKESNNNKGLAAPNGVTKAVTKA